MDEPKKQEVDKVPALPTGPVRVRMTRSVPASYDGINIVYLNVGTEHVLNADLARALVGYYEIIEEKKQDLGSPENKMASVPENK